MNTKFTLNLEVKMLVVKIGGAAGLDHESLCRDIARQWQSGTRLVVVHGGSSDTDALSVRLGHPQRTITSPSGHTSRYTDRTTLEIFTMATAHLNRTLVERLQGMNVNAFGLSGADGRVIEAKRKEAVRSVENGKVRMIRDDWTGTISSVNAPLLQTLLDGGYLPVIAPLAISERGELLNVDGDRAAAFIASALGAETLLLLSNVPGLMRSFPDESTLITHVAPGEVEQSMEWARGRMKKKVMGAGEALQRGVRTVIIGDGRRSAPISDALGGAGTTLGQLLPSREVNA